LALGSSLPVWAHDELHGGCQFTSEQAGRAEERVRRNPADVMSHAQLLGYYYCQGNLHGPGASPAGHLREVLWFIQNHPESPVLSEQASRFDLDLTPWAQGFEEAKRAWLRAVARYPGNAKILANAAYCLEYRDQRLSLDLFKRALALEPANPTLASELGTELGRAIVQNPLGHPTAEETALANQARQELAQSQNAFVLGSAGLFLENRLPALAQTYLRRTISIDPNNPEWRGDEIARQPQPNPADWRRAYGEYLRKIKANPLPRFEQYPVNEVFTGKAVRPKVELGPEEDPDVLGDREDWSLLHSYQKGPLFAGHYRFATWTCGSECFVADLIDVRTGEVFDTPFGSLSWGYIFYLHLDQGSFKPLDYRANSSLLIANGCPGEFDCGTRVYKWDGKNFLLVRFVPIDPSAERPPRK
jgi:hypothetical protein